VFPWLRRGYGLVNRFIGSSLVVTTISSYTHCCFLGTAGLKWSQFLSLSLMLRPMVSRPVCFGIKHPSGAYDQIFIIVWQLRVCWFGAPSLTRGWVCRLQLLLALVSTVIFWSESHRTRGHILLSQIRDFPIRPLLRLAGSWWKYSIPPPHGFEVNSHSRILSYPLGTDHTQKTSHMISISPVHWLADFCLAASYKNSSYCCVTLSEKVFIALLPNYTRCKILYSLC
jgi:hypothetical protein